MQPVTFRRTKYVSRQWSILNRKLNFQGTKFLLLEVQEVKAPKVASLPVSDSNEHHKLIKEAFYHSKVCGRDTIELCSSSC